MKRATRSKKKLEPVIRRVGKVIFFIGCGAWRPDPAVLHNALQYHVAADAQAPVQLRGFERAMLPGEYAVKFHHRTKAKKAFADMLCDGAYGVDNIEPSPRFEDDEEMEKLARRAAGTLEKAPRRTRKKSK